MARIESTAIGDGRRSLGNITYRYVNGKTIASKRITTNTSRTPKQEEHRRSFSITCKLARALAQVTKIGLASKKYTTSYNNFIHENKDFMYYSRTSDKVSSDALPIENLYEAVNDASFTGKVVIADGGLNLINVFAISAEDKLSCKMYFSRDFRVDDTITLAICSTYTLVGAVFESIEVYSKTLMRKDIDALQVGNQFEINESTFPDVDLYGHYPSGYENVCSVVAAIVSSDKDRSYSVFQEMPVK